MPTWHIRIQDALNELLSSRNISKLQELDFVQSRPAVTLDGIVETINAQLADADSLTDDEIHFVQSLPEGLKYAFGAAVQSAILRGIPVQVAWRPAYYADIQIWDVGSVQLKSGVQTPGAMTIIVSTRLPNDPLP